MTKGREFNHLEDLVFFYGLEGAKSVVRILQDWETSQNDLTVKWDGKLSVYYGRNSKGYFVLGTIANWRKNTPCYSGLQIKEHILNTGNGEEWRIKMADDLEQTFAYLEAATPKDFRQFVKGDLLFSPIMAPVKETTDGLQFTPAQVTYTTNRSSDIGKQIEHANVGIALHTVYDGWGHALGLPITDETVSTLNSGDVVALGQTYVPTSPKIHPHLITRIQMEIDRRGDLIDVVVGKRKGLSDMANILYTFINHTSRTTIIHDISRDEFFKWLYTSKVSANKQIKIKLIDEEEPKAFFVFFNLMHMIMDAKNITIYQLNSADTDIKANIGLYNGGEGYMSLKHKVKLVPRHEWRIQ